MNKPLDYFTKKNVLITGGAGCIGNNLTQTILGGNPSRVTIIDDLSASYAWNIPKDPRLTFVQGSILDDEKLDAVFSSNPDFVFHLAAHFANQNSIDHPDLDLLVNGQGTLKILQRSQRAGVKSFLYASSGCSVYGSEAPLPLRENYVSLHLDTPYQITKLLGELYCNFYHDYYGLPVVIARFFNVYGPGEVPGRYRNVIPNFIYWALSRRPLPIMGTGDETRDWTYVSDIVDGVLRCATNEAAVGEAINLASGVETRVSDIAETINKVTGNTSGISHVPRRDWDKISRRKASIDKASNLIGYRPRVQIQEGIVNTMKWMTANMSRISEDVKL